MLNDVIAETNTKSKVHVSDIMNANLGTGTVYIKMSLLVVAKLVKTPR